jgi:hypothetical protein
LVDLGDRRRRRLISGLRRALASAFGRSAGAGSSAPASARTPEAQRRIDAARRRLKATIPPPQDDQR